MEKFKKGDKVKRVGGDNDEEYGLFIGNNYIVKTVQSKGWLILEGLEQGGSWYPDYFELVEPAKPELSKQEIIQALKDLKTFHYSYGEEVIKREDIEALIKQLEQ